MIFLDQVRKLNYISTSIFFKENLDLNSQDNMENVYLGITHFFLFFFLLNSYSSVITFRQICL